MGTILAMISGGMAWAADPAPAAQSNSIYVHCIGANPKADGAAMVLLTARMVDLEDASASRVLVAPRGMALTGQVRPMGEKFFVKLSGAFGLSQGDFEGLVEPDKRYAPSAMAFTGAVTPFSIVVSRQSDPAAFLKKPFYEKGAGNVMKPVDEEKPGKAKE